MADALANRGPSVSLDVLAVSESGSRRRRDRLAAEEPLEIRVAGPTQEAIRVAVTMRTPGDDFALAAGFLLTEGLLGSADEVASIRYCADVPAEENRFNVLTVELRQPFDASRLARNFYATSSCGVCGKASIDHIEQACARLVPGPEVAADVIAGLPATLRASQRVFSRTGGLHAVGLFSAGGELLDAFEDVGRHNAMDKLVGSRLLARELPAAGTIGVVSGRASFELVQKAAMAGIPILCAISAPSTLAVATASRLGMTLVGFLRGQRFNVYAGAERIIAAAAVRG